MAKKPQLRGANGSRVFTQDPAANTRTKKITPGASGAAPAAGGANSLGVSEQEYGQISMYAAMVGLSPEEYVTRMNETGGGDPAAFNARLQATNANPAAATEFDRRTAAKNADQWAAFDALDPERAAIRQQSTLIDDNYQRNQQQINDLGSYGKNVGAANNGLMGDIYNQLNWQDGANRNYNTQNRDLVNQLSGYRDSANAFDWNNLNTFQNALNTGTQQNNASLGQLGGLYDQLGGPMQSQVSWAGDLSSQAAQARADPQAIQAQYDALSQLQGVGSGSLDQQSQAAQARASQAAIEAQYNAAGRLDNIANGSLNYQSQAQWAVARPEDIRDQEAAAYGLAVMGRGGADVHLADLGDNFFNIQSAEAGKYDVDLGQLGGYKDLVAASKGSKDINVGQEDPAAYAALLDAQSKYKALTTPEVTGQERLIYETARLKQEQDERANRGAVMNDLRQRGMSGSGYEIAQGALAGQQNSQNRLLSDLGAQSNAIQRSMDALSGYAGVSGNLNQQGNMVAAQNQAAQMNALQQYATMDATNATNNTNRRYDAAQSLFNMDAELQSNNMNRRVQAQSYASQAYATLRAQGFSEDYARKSAADEASQFNANLQFQGSQAAYAARSDIRSQEFNESYSRGVAQDNMSNANANRRLQGMEASGQLASTARSQSFNEEFSRGAAADQTAQFNRTQSLDVAKFNTEFAASERDSQWSRGTDMFSAQRNVTDSNLGIANAGFNAGRTTNADTFGRNTQVLGAVDSANTREWTMNDQATQRRIGAAATNMGVNSDNFNRDGNVVGLGINNQNLWTQGQLGVQGQNAGVAAADKASTQAWRLGGGGGTGSTGFNDFMNGEGEFG